jgi:acyl carrier protein
MELSEAKRIVKETIVEVTMGEVTGISAISDDMPLIGGQSALDSMKLVELCLALEDKAAAAGFDFDWTSETAMSRSRGMFRTAGALAEAFSTQSTVQK